MYVSISFVFCEWHGVIDLFADQTRTEFKWYPQFYFDKQVDIFRHIGVHWLGCCICLEK